MKCHKQPTTIMTLCGHCVCLLCCVASIGGNFPFSKLPVCEVFNTGGVDYKYPTLEMMCNEAQLN